MSVTHWGRVTLRLHSLTYQSRRYPGYLFFCKRVGALETWHVVAYEKGPTAIDIIKARHMFYRQVKDDLAKRAHDMKSTFQFDGKDYTVETYEGTSGCDGLKSDYMV